jgi:hypothetical protein
MKGKIKEALKQRYSNLGLSDEAFDGVASSVQTVITDETLEGFVSGAEPLLKQFQSIADTARSRKVAELEAKVKELEGGKGAAENQPAPAISLEDITAKVSEAVAAAVKPLNDEITALKGASAAKEAFASARSAFFGGDYAKKYADEANDAWERVAEINEATGSKMTTDELKAKAEAYFNKAVARKGVDTSKPFKAEPVNELPDFSDDAKILQDAGLLPKDKQ